MESKTFPTREAYGTGARSDQVGSRGPSGCRGLVRDHDGLVPDGESVGRQRPAAAAVVGPLDPANDRYLAMLRLSVARSALIVNPHWRYSASAAALSGSVCRDGRSAPESMAACWMVRPADGRCLGDAPRGRRTGRVAARSDPAQEMSGPGEWLRIRPSADRGERRRTRHLVDPRPCGGRSRRLAVVDPVQLEQARQLLDRVRPRIDRTTGDGLWHQHTLRAQPLQEDDHRRGIGSLRVPILDAPPLSGD